MRGALEEETVTVPVQKLKNAAIYGLTVLFSYALSVGEEIGTEKAFQKLVEVFNEHHLKWAKENKSRLDIGGDDCIAAEALVNTYLRDTGLYTFGQLIPYLGGTSETEFQRYVVRDPKHVVVRHSMWCPIIEVAKNLNVETKYLCEVFIFPEWEKVLKATIHPNVTITPVTVRPEADYCEEAYEIKD